MSGIRTIIGLGCISVTISLLAGCSDGGKKSVATKDYEDHSCQFKAEEGGNFSYAGPQVTSTYFDKSYNRGAFEAVFNASAKETARFIQEVLNVNVFQTSSTGRYDCSPLGFLPQADSGAMNKWNHDSGTVDEDSKLLGLYLSRADLPTSATATILIVPDTVRWSLVHEMLHHLFDNYLQSRSDYVDSKTLVAGIKSAAAEVKVACPSDLSCDYARVQRPLVKFLNLFDQQMIRYTLEEMTNETTLSKAFHDGRFAWLTDESKNSINYISQSAKMASKYYNQFLGAIREVKNKQGHSEELSELERRYNNRISRIQSVLYEAESIDGYPTHRLTDNLTGGDETGTDAQPCSHSENEKTGLDIADSVLNSFAK